MKNNVQLLHEARLKIDQVKTSMQITETKNKQLKKTTESTNRNDNSHRERGRTNTSNLYTNKNSNVYVLFRKSKF